MSSINLEIVTPTKILERSDISYVRCPGLNGYFGVMSGHQKAVIGLGIGEIKVTKGGKDDFYATSGGFAEITGEKIQLLVETIEKSSEINTNRAEKSITRAKDRISLKDEKDLIRAENSLLRAVNRLKVSSQ